MKLLAALLAVLALALPSGAARADASPRSATVLTDDRLAEVVQHVGASGGVWASVEHGRVTHVGAVGRDGDGQPMTERTPFVLGSVSKPMLATLVTTMADRGTVDLDVRVAPKLPALQRISGAEAITVRHLLTHTSGLPFGADHLDRPDPARTAGGVVAGLRGIHLESRPGARYSYSSLGYLVLTAWLEAETGQRLGQLYGRYLPLDGLQTAGVTVPRGHRSPVLPAMATPIDPAGAGYGYAAGTVRTMAQLAASVLDDRERLERMTAVRPRVGETLTGLGWRVTNDGARQRVWHTGMVPGYFTAVYLLPEEGRAVVVALNRSSVVEEQALYDASMSLLGDMAVPTLWRQWAALAAVLLLGVGAGLVALRRQWLGLLLVAVIASGPALLPVALGQPVRYGWLWAPDLVLAMLVSAVLALLVAGVSRIGRRPLGA